MKKKNILVLILCLVMLLTACGKQTAASAKWQEFVISAKPRLTGTLDF